MSKTDLFSDPVWEHAKNETTKRKFFNARAAEVHESQVERHKERMQYVGASEVSSIIGCNSFKDHRTLWKEKKGLIEPEADMEEKLHVQAGVYFEGGIINLFNLDAVAKKQTKRRFYVHPSGQERWVHPFVKGMAATPDAYGFMEGRKGLGLFDIKFSSGWGVHKEDGKEEWHWQLMHQMACAPVHFDFAAILMMGYASPQGFLTDADGDKILDDNGWPMLEKKRYPKLLLKAFVYDRDEDMIETCETAVEDFWNSIEKGKAPRE